ncbi:MAG: radical SAM protein [Nitrospirae bacterium]|nr:radical SAM protein [Nitrospirota bacterium]
MPADLRGVLFAPDRLVPIHRESVRRFVTRIRQDRPACFIPEVPVASELGLPRYEPLLYWIPAHRDIAGRVWQRIRERLGSVVGGRAVVTQVPAHCEQFTELSREEQVHYFAEHLHAICPKPIQVSVIVSNICNLKCVMCPYHSPDIRPTHQTDFFKDRVWMPWEMMDKLASECGASQIPVKIGNVEEPLLHPHIVEFVHACRTRGVPWIHITTNGVTLTEKLASDLLEAGLTSLYVSLDAARPETYRRIRGSVLEQVESNLRAFLRLRREKGVSCSVMASFVRNKGVSEEEIFEFREKWLRNSDGVIFYNLAEYESGNSVFKQINRVAKEKMEKVGGRWPCLNPWQEIYILPDGRVYYCCETVSKLAFEQLESMGRYPEQSLLELWRGEPFTALRRDLVLNKLDRWPACQKCGIWMAHVTATTLEDGVRTTTNMITEIIQCQTQ